MNIRRHIVNMASASLDSGSSDRSAFYPMSNHNIVVGLNGALQKRFILSGDNLVPGNVHRAARVDVGIGGKGQDVAIALHCLVDKKNDGVSNANTSTDANIRLAQFIGTGFAGDIVYGLLEDQLGEETLTYTVRSSSEMRTCTSIVAADETTELVEPSGVITKTEVEELFSILSNNRNEESIDTSPRSLCIMGSMPPGCPEDTYARIYEKLAGPNTVCVVDSLAGTIPLLQTLSQSSNSDNTITATGPVLFKMNASELCKLAGTPKSNSETDGISLSELIHAIERFLSKYPNISNINESHRGVIGLAITDGKHDGYFVAIGNKSLEDEVLKPFEIFQLPVPNLGNGGSRTLYPIGAGDAVAAGTIAAWTTLMAKDDTPTVIPEDSLAPLVAFQDEIVDNYSNLPIGFSLVQARAIAAFAFGLACGSASCLQEQNSVLDVSDVTTLFKDTSRSPPKIIISK